MKQISQLPLAVQLPDDETFASYISEQNQHIIVQLKTLVAANAKTQKLKSVKKIKVSSNKACYLFGQLGCGKSHLLHACCVYASELSLSSLCLSFSELQHLSVEVLDGLEQIDVVCLDDIQFMAGNTQWQQAVFDLFNRMIEQDRCLIISGSQAVSHLGLSLPDLESRLSWGVVAQIKPLSDDDKMIAFQFRAKQRGLLLQDETVKFLFNRLSRDLGDLLVYLDQLDKASIQEQRKITIPFIKEVLALN
ncbi:MAG: DnaA regulatory inactivator Hda [Alteromonadaceae bacterium]|nr:DnaA regulatory inactivator Hda [Alteromonadaceae bacterium]